MRIIGLVAASAFAIACAIDVLGAAAQQGTVQPSPAQAAAQTQQPASAPTPAVDREALAALQRMGAYLRTLQSFEVQTNTTIDMVMAEDGQKLQFDGTGLYRVRRPNAFFIEQRTDRRHRQYFYDGSTFTVYSPRMHYYAQVAAPGTIIETINLAEERYNVFLPLTDLFYWGTPEDESENITSAQHVGFARVGDVAADHYAFRQGDVDWQIWIQRGERSLPLKIVITSREIEGEPQFSSLLRWNLNPRFRSAAFTFTPSGEARRIQIAANEE
ncbi:MAG: DUF2092 domain-containing protein [Vitreimonas sp.]